MSINFDTGTLYSRVGKYQVGNADDYSKSLNKATQAADETANSKVDNRYSSEDPSTGEILYYGNSAAPQTSIFGLAGNWLYNLVHGGPRQETGFVGNGENGIPVADEPGSTVSALDTDNGQPVQEAPATGGTA